MQLVIQRATDPVPFRGAYFRVTEPGRVGLVLAPPTDDVPDEEVLARLLGLALALGAPASGRAPIRQHWLDEGLRFTGKLGSVLAPAHAAEAERLAARVRAEWDRFVTNALARLRGEPRGDAHFRYPGGEWSPAQPAVQVTAWPPLPGERLPPLD